MSEIEKMYKNAGVDYEERYNNCILNKEGECELKCNCDICKYSEEKYIYPSFSAEKQIELIKWLSDFADFGTFSIDHDKSEYGIAFCINDDGYYFVDKIFEECIAKVVKNLWQSLTEEEHKQIKEILE